MEKNNLKEYRDWFIGNFSPSIFPTETFEIGIKNYVAGEEADAHYHKIAIEYTIILEGTVEINGELFSKGDIITISPLEVAEFKSLTDSSTLVVKIPSVPGDKYII